MKLNHRYLGTALAAVALAGLTACGGPEGSEAPTDASKDEFCTVINGLDTSDPEGFVDDLVEVGTPSDIPDEAREGFEVMVDNATSDEISDSKQEKVSTFVAWFTTTCSGS